MRLRFNLRNPEEKNIFYLSIEIFLLLFYAVFLRACLTNTAASVTA